MWRTVVWLALLSGAACASSPARLSESIYLHEMQAASFEANGDHGAAAAERAKAQRERERLSGKQRMISARDDR